MGTRIFSAQLGDGDAPENRTVDNDAPAGMRLELIDSVFNLAEANQYNRDDAVAEGQLYRVLVQSMGLAQAPANPMNGFRNGAGRQMRELPWPRVYDLICRWFGEFPPDLQGEYVERVNILLSGYRIVWELRADGTLHRILPQPVQAQVEATFTGLRDPRFAAARGSLRAAFDAYDARPQRSRDACKNAMDALESAAKEIFTMPAATLGNVLTEARRRQSMAQETVTVLQRLYDMANNHFRHGMVTPFTLTVAEVDFVLLSCMAGILLFVRL
jgi:hypothetical protein